MREGGTLLYLYSMALACYSQNAERACEYRLVSVRVMIAMMMSWVFIVARVVIA